MCTLHACTAVVVCFDHVKIHPHEDIYMCKIYCIYIKYIYVYIVHYNNQFNLVFKPIYIDTYIYISNYFNI